MEQHASIEKQLRVPNFGHTRWYVLLVAFVIALAVLQDYLFSRTRHTGFYISESLLYHTFWIFFIPLTMLANKLVRLANPKKIWAKAPLNIGVALFFSFSHLLLFTSLFVLVSTLVFTPSHRFIGMFNTALSNQFYITLLWYAIVHSIAIALRNLNRTPSPTGVSEVIRLKKAGKIVTLPKESIQYIITDKPYSTIYTKDQKFLDNRNLKQLEAELNPSIFARVHRSSIVNTTAITELISRNNGDFDATLQDGKIIRFSRHYRANWDHLLH